MEADTVRLILIVVGVAAILALYLWERSRSGDDQEEDYAEDYADEYGDADADMRRGNKREPNLGELDSDDARGGGAWGASRDHSDRAADDDSSASWDDEDDEDDAQSGPQPLLIQLIVSTRGADFEGPDILEVAETCGLRPGEMDIFHCLDNFDEGTRVYFSMANMVKPGTFPFEEMDDFATPGLMLFAQLEGDPEDLTILDEMTATARKLANVLGGDVLDDTRRALTVKKEEELRAAILTNEERWGKARHW